MKRKPRDKARTHWYNLRRGYRVLSRFDDPYPYPVQMQGFDKFQPPCQRQASYNILTTWLCYKKTRNRYNIRTMIRWDMRRNYAPA